MTDASGRREARISAFLFALTALTVVLAYTVFFADGPVASFGDIVSLPRLRQGLLFGVSLMAILGAHEMAHYFAARAHGFSLSLPYFIPFPNLFGTMGAVIRLRSLPRSRQALLEMGAAGPLAGALVSFVVLAITLRWSGVGEIPPGATVYVFNDSLAVKLIGLLTTGAPPGRLAVLHPAAMAAWAGCLLTGVNLMPIGQLDGGHVLNAVAPCVARVVSRVGPLVLLAGGWWWSGWSVWGFLLLLLPAGRPLPVPEAPEPPLRSRLIALTIAALFALTFIPIPAEVETTPGPVIEGAP